VSVPRLWRGPKLTMPPEEKAAALRRCRAAYFDPEVDVRDVVRRFGRVVFEEMLAELAPEDIERARKAKLVGQAPTQRTTGEGWRTQSQLRLAAKKRRGKL
jgi:hypothetical protein